MSKEFYLYDFDEVDYLLINCLLNNDETEDDCMRMLDKYLFYKHMTKQFDNYLHIQNPCPVGDKTDTINLHRDDEE